MGMAEKLVAYKENGKILLDVTEIFDGRGFKNKGKPLTTFKENGRILADLSGISEEGKEYRIKKGEGFIHLIWTGYKATPPNWDKDNC